MTRHPPLAWSPRVAPRAALQKPRRALMLWFWSVLALGLVAWNGWMTLELFGPDEPWQRLTNQEPILSGRHPLHLYHGYLGARSFLAWHGVSCYDPAFQAGMPKTPVFDSGSRPAELFLTIAGGSYDPAAYKIGLAVCCLLVPIFVIVACWGAGFNAATTCLATAAGLLIWWSTPARLALAAGDIDLLLAALAILAHVGLLLRFDRQPSLLTWQGMLLTGCLGWFAHPMLCLIVLPLLLVYYLSIGVHHELTTWHVTLALSEVGALLLNSFWLTDWLRHWWLRSPLPSREGMLPHRTFATIWTAPQWGEHPDRILTAILLCSAVLGVALLNQARQRVSARLLLMGAGGLWLLAILGISWEPLGEIGTADLMVPALFFATLPAAYAWTRLFQLVACLAGSPVRGALLTCVTLAALAFAGRDLVERWAERVKQTTHFTMGLGPEREALVEALKKTTTQAARILWEDVRSQGQTSRWTALLPLLTGRYFIGGLDPNGTIPHSGVGLVDLSLRGRALTFWQDAELEGYCRRYNVGWIVCRSPEAVARFRAWPSAVETAQMNDGEPLVLFALPKAPHNFALKGRATVVHMDSHHITLKDVVPAQTESGEWVVVLSLHYQTGLRAAPESVKILREPDDGDLIPFIRLGIDRPLAVVTLTWAGR